MRDKKVFGVRYAPAVDARTHEKPTRREEIQ